MSCIVRISHLFVSKTDRCLNKQDSDSHQLQIVNALLATVMGKNNKITWQGHLDGALGFLFIISFYFSKKQECFCELRILAPGLIYLSLILPFCNCLYSGAARNKNTSTFRYSRRCRVIANGGLRLNGLNSYLPSKLLRCLGIFLFY